VCMCVHVCGRERDADEAEMLVRNLPHDPSFQLAMSWSDTAGWQSCAKAPAQFPNINFVSWWRIM